MRSSLKFLSNGFRGLVSSSSSPQSSCPESKSPRSELKKHVISRVTQATNGVPEQRLILSTVIPLLDGISDEALLQIIRVADAEFDDILSRFDGKGISGEQLLAIPSASVTNG